MILSVENLHKSFGGINACRNVNLNVTAGQIHAVVGPNGAGKTTLISQLSGSLKPDSGKIIFDNTDITNLSIHNRVHLGLARSFQITSVILPMTLLENVLLAVQSIAGHSFGFWHPASRNKKFREKAMQCLQSVGLDARADVVADEVSHGEQRQLEIALALALQPKLLLLDEPMAGMSKEETGKMIALLKSLKGKITMLLIEHDMDAVYSLADRTSVLVNGFVIASGETHEIRKNPEVQRAYLGDQH